MADSNKVDINFNAETRKASGDVKKFKGELETIGPSGKKTAASISGSFKTIESSINKVRKAISMVSFGTMWVNAIADIVAKFHEWRNAAEKAAEKTRELQKAAADDAAAAQVERLSNAYRNLSASIADASRERQRQDELFNEKLRVAREAEDAEMDAGEAEELAGVDPDAADADRQRSSIRDRWAAKRARRTAERRKHDVVNRRMSLTAQAEADAKAADELESSLTGDDKAIGDARNKAANLESWSTQRNEKDIRWYAPGGRTEEGDKVREEQRQEAKKLREEIKRMEKEKAAKEREIAELRAKAAHASEMADALGGALDTADVQRQTAVTKENTAAGIKKAAQKAEEERRASALAAAPRLSQEAEDLKARIAAEQAKKDAANLGVFKAQNALDLARANGGKTGNATAALQEAQAAANDVNASSDAAINALTKTLKDVEARLKAAQSYFEKESKRNAWEATDINAAGAK